MSTAPGAGVPRAGLELARQWAEALPAEQLHAALQAIEPELCREHARLLLWVQLNHDWAVEQERLAVERERLARQDAQAQRAHHLYLTGLRAGFLISTMMLIGSVVVDIYGDVWLAGLLAGPSVIALATLFVLRRTDSAATRGAARQLPPDPGTPPA